MNARTPRKKTRDRSSRRFHHIRSSSEPPATPLHVNTPEPDKSHDGSTRLLKGINGLCFGKSNDSTGSAGEPFPLYQSEGAIVDALCTAWNALCDEAGRLTTLTSYLWIIHAIDRVSK